MSRTRVMENVIVVGLCLIVLCTVGSLRAEKPTQTITGAVTEAESTRGKVISVYITDPGLGRVLVVRSTEVGKELLKQVGVTVRATGYLKKRRPDSKFQHIIDVLSYEVVSSSEPAP